MADQVRSRAQPLAGNTEASSQSILYDLRSLYAVIIFMTLIPVPYYVFKIAHYGFGWTPLGVLLWLMPTFFILLMAADTGRGFKAPPRQIHWHFPFDQIYLVLAWLAALLIVIENLYLRRPADVGLFDLQLYHSLLGQGEITTLSPLGYAGLLLSGFAFYLVPRAPVQRALLERLLFVLPATIISLVNAAMGLRQTFMFFSVLLFFAFMIRVDIRRRWSKVIGAMMLVVFAIAYVGYSRLSTFGGSDELIAGFILSLADTGDSIDMPTSLHAVLTYIFLYAGSAPEGLSIFTEVATPNWVLFSQTNTLLYNVMSKLIELPSYEHELRYLAHDKFQAATGYFARIWATGHVQLYLEGGLFYVALWYAGLIVWYRRLRDAARKGLDILQPTCLFASLLTLNMLAFPLREPIIFLAFATFLTLTWLERRLTDVRRTGSSDQR